MIVCKLFHNNKIFKPNLKYEPLKFFYIYIKFLNIIKFKLKF